MDFISGQKLISELHFNNLKEFLDSREIEYQIEETPIPVNPSIGLFKTEWDFLFNPDELDKTINSYVEYLNSYQFWKNDEFKEYRDLTTEELKELLLSTQTPIIEIQIAKNILTEKGIDFSDIQKVQETRDKEEFEKHISSVSGLFTYGYVLAFFTGLIGLIFASYIKSQCNKYYKGQDKDIQLKYIKKANSLQNFSLIMIFLHLVRLFYVYST